MNKNKFINQIKASSKTIKCDLVIKNITIIDVFNKDRYVDNVGIKDGYIVGIGDYDAPNIIDGSNKFICPGLIDAHCHIESSLVTPREYSKACLLNGITSVIADPHEIGNVMGTKGIDYMLDSSKSLPFDFYFMLPSCVPGTDFENSGATLLSQDLKPYYENNSVLGLAEVMNYPAVANADENMISKLYDAKLFNKVIDGHGAGLDSMMTNCYRTANITTDHECITSSEATEKVRRGMYILMREGSVAKNLKDLLPAVTESNSNRFCLCTDDKHIDDILLNGSINKSIITSINYGLKPETAIQMATINTSTVYKINNKGAIAPGYIADFILLDNLEEFKINSVYKNGKKVVEGNKIIIDLYKDSNESSSDYHNSLNLPTLTKDSFSLNLSKDKYKTLNVIEIIPNKLESIHLKVNVNDFISSINSNNGEYAKISVIERHKKTGNIGLGILKGFGLKHGAIATTIAHDSHNLIIAGTNDSDMLFAAKELEKIHGGIIVVQDNKLLASIKLEIGGLMTNRGSSQVKKDLIRLHEAINLVSPNIDFNPFLTLSFLSLPVIPELKITDKGLFDVTNFKFIDLLE